MGNTLAVPPGFSPGSAGALGLISGIIGPKDTDEKIWTSQIVAWMPKDQAETPTEAWDKLSGMLWDALSSVVRSVQFPDGYTPKEFSWNQDGGTWLQVGDFSLDVPAAINQRRHRKTGHGGSPLF